MSGCCRLTEAQTALSLPEIIELNIALDQQEASP